MNIKIGIVVLNYNNAPDTIHAIQSILQSQQSSKHVLIVVDNSSTDDSWQRLTKSNSFNKSILQVNNVEAKSLSNLPVVNVLQSLQNKGYAYGNNCGIKQCLLDDTINYVWVLNNDVEIKEDCLVQIESTLQSSASSIGIWGTLLANYFDKSKIQAIAGKYYPLLAKTKLYLPNFPIERLNNQLIQVSCKNANYFIGASLIFSKFFLEKVGLFNEQYFLYAEEIDIFLRARKMGYGKAMIDKAIVYHKEGGTTKLINAKEITRSAFIEFHNCRSKLIYTKNHFPYYYPIVYFFIALNLVWLYKNNFNKVKVVFQSLRKDKFSV